MSKENLPLVPLLALTCLAFSAIITELLPAGVLIEMANDLDVPISSIGQLVSYYAIGTVLTAIPAAALTNNISRKPLLLFVISGFFVSNVITAYSQNYFITVIVRIIVGGFGGTLWPLIAGYASRLVSTKNTGKAIAIVMAGSTLALCIGLPAGAFISQLIGWRSTFGLLSCMELIIIGWIVWKIPDFKADKKSETIQVSKVLLLPGVSLVLLTTFTASLAVYISYTYLSSILIVNGIKDNTGLALLLFGIGAVCGIFITGRFIDAHLRTTFLCAMLLGATSLLFIGLAGQIHLIFYVSIVLWGVSFGGLPSLLQTATIGAARGAHELGSSMTVTVYNIGIFSGAFIGGIILDFSIPFALTWISFILMVVVIFFVIVGYKFAFPKHV
jgi:predicted MFS family arabinose efflux permease